MERRASEEYKRANIIIDAVCRAGNVSYEDLVCHPKNMLFNILRGLCCVFAKEYDVHPSRMHDLLRRTRCNIINQGRKYKEYIDSQDPYTMRYYIEAKSIIDDNIWI